MTGFRVTRFATGRTVTTCALLTTACAALTAVSIIAATAGKVGPTTWAGWGICTLMSAWILRTHLRGWQFVRDHPTLAAGSRQMATIAQRLTRNGSPTAWRNDTEHVVFVCRRRRFLRHSTWQLLRWTDDTIVDLARDLGENQAATILTDTFLVQSGTPVMLIPSADAVRGSLDGALLPTDPQVPFWRRLKTVRMLFGTGLGYASDHDLTEVLRQLAEVRPMEIDAF